MINGDKQDKVKVREDFFLNFDAPDTKMNIKPERIENEKFNIK